MKQLILLAVSFLIWATSFAQEVDKQLTKNAYAIVINESTKVSFDSPKKYKQQYFRRVKILSKKGENLQDVAIHYKEGSEELDDIKITIYDGDGKKIKSVKSKDLEDYSSSDGYSMITDYRVKYWKYESNTYPHIIEYSYTKESDNTLSLPSWNPIPGYNVAVQQSLYKIEATEELRSKELNFDEFESIEKDGMSFKMSNQAALNKEKFSVPSMNIFPALVVNPVRFSFEGYEGTFASWQGFGQWIYDSFLKKKKLKKPQAVKKQLDAVIGSNDSQLEIAKKIYDFIQENTRYVSIALEEGGLNPLNPNKVHEVKYGDCKALSWYMHVLLDLYDIESNYTVVHAGSDYPISLFEDYPSTFPGNHVILRMSVDDDEKWVDCTSSKNPFGYLGEFTDDRSVLCINPQGGTLTKTPALSKEENLKVETIDLRLDDKGNAVATINHKSHGYSISRDIWFSDLSKEKQEDYIKEDLFDDIGIATCDKMLAEVDESAPTSNVSFEVEVPLYAEIAGDYAFISNALAPLTIPKLPKDGKRESDIYFPRSYSQSSTINIATDSDYELIDIEPISFESEYGKYTKEIKTDGETITVIRTFALDKQTYPKSDYKKIKSFFDKCLKSDREQTTIKKL